VDTSEESIATAIRKQKAFDISYAVIDAAGNDLPFGEPFDLVIVCGVLHHIPRDELSHVFFRIKTHIKPGGLLFIFEHNPYHPVIQWMFRKREIKYDPHAVMLKPRFLRDQLAKAGCIPSRASYALFFPRFLSGLLPLEKHMTGVPLGAQYYVIAENPKMH
jgi:SAM-dependent methyltransferase